MKNSRKREVALVASGIVFGMAIVGSAAHAAEEILAAQRSTQKIYVDGQQIQMETYSISGSNYVKLRDIGKAAGFSVTYDPLTNTVRINMTEPYADGSTAQSSHTVKFPTDGSKYIPQVENRILCNDDTDYAITDVRRWGINISPLPDLPSATCDWSKFPILELPQAEARHFTNQDRDIFLCQLVLRIYAYTTTVPFPCFALFSTFPVAQITCRFFLKQFAVRHPYPENRIFFVNEAQTTGFGKAKPVVLFVSR